MKFRRVFLGLAAALAMANSAAAQVHRHNLIIFVADGLRAGSVTPETAPELARVRAEGVDFANSHSVYPTVTTVNASAIATGHYPGDTGDFGNLIYVGDPLPLPAATPIAALESDAVLGAMNARFGGDYLGEVSLLQAARAAGYATAAVGKLGPTAIQDVTARDGSGTIVIDDATARAPPAGLPLAADVQAAIGAAGLSAKAPGRGRNGAAGSFDQPGTRVANLEQQDWFAAVAAKVLLPRFKTDAKPFVLVFWSRDPDGTQHNQGDSLNKLDPGINGPTSKAAVGNASKDLGELRAALDRLGLADDTDIIVTADHGFSTMTRNVPSSASARFAYPDVAKGFVPPGFLAIDLAEGLGLALRDGAGRDVDPARGMHPRGGARLGGTVEHPEVVIAPNGGTDLIWLPGADARALAARVVAWLTTQDYVASIFVRDDLGPIPGALPTSKVNLLGGSRTPPPAIVVGFRTSVRPGCGEPELCAVEIADSSQQEGQGIHGSLGRQDTHNFMAAIGPDFRKGFVDPAPVSNADWTPTMARVLGFDMPAGGKLRGRVMHEALAADGSPADAGPWTARSEPAANGFVTVLKGQTADGVDYFDAAGAPGRTVGLAP